MRQIQYISPSALSKWAESRDDFYKNYLCATRTARPPQESYMAVGSAFDAFVKSGIYDAVHGDGASKGTQFDRDGLFEAQVEPHCRDSVGPMAEHLFDEYIKSGAYAHLLADVVGSPYEPEMEFTVKGIVNGIPLLGKPDLRYITKSGIHVIADFKVNGSMSATGASPIQGYKVCWDSYASRTHGKSHAKYEAYDFRGLEINKNYLNEFCTYWADQLGIYAWVLGENVGSEDFIIRMEQIACRPVKSQPLPRAKCATHLSRISKEYQATIMQKLSDCWNGVQSGHIFDYLSREESDARCEMLDMAATMPKNLHPALCFDEGRMRVG